MTHSRPIATISAAAARDLTDAAAAAAAEIGVPMCIAVTCTAGHLIHFLRRDGARSPRTATANNRPYPPPGFARAPHGWPDSTKNAPPLLHGIVHTDRLVTFGGGYPVKEEGAVIGGFGISGGHYHQDMEVATKALAAVGLAAE